MAFPVSRPSGGMALAAAVDAHYRQYRPHEVQEQMHTYAQVDVALAPREVHRRKPDYGTPGILQGVHTCWKANSTAPMIGAQMPSRSILGSRYPRKYNSSTTGATSPELTTCSTI